MDSCCPPGLAGTFSELHYSLELSLPLPFHRYQACLIWCPFRSFGHLKNIELLLFLLLNLKSSLYIWDISPLSNMCFESISSQSVGLTSHSLNRIFQRAVLISMKSNINFSLSGIMLFCIIFKNLSPNQDHLDFFLRYFLEVL